MPNYSPTRRRFLTIGLLGAMTATTGCVNAVRTANENPRSLQFDLSHHDGSLRDRYVIDLSETRPERDEDAFEAALNGRRYTFQYHKPFLSTSEDPAYAKHRGTYYRLGSVVVDETTAIHPVLRLRDATTDTESSDSVIDAEQLPSGDQRAVEIAHLAARARGNKGGVPWGIVQRGGYVYRQAESIEASQLLAESGPTYVDYRETRYAVDIAHEQFYEPIYRATVEPVATNPEQMETILRAILLDARINQEELTQAARALMHDARNDGYSEHHPFSAEFRMVLTALEERAYLDGNIENDAIDRDGRRRMMLFDEEYYTYRLGFQSEPT